MKLVKNMSFRFDINALRAIAVIGVVLFHFDFPFFGGGFSGVDIFFVISGYLMTGIVVKSLETSSFSLINFYTKRAKRIIPALLFLITVLFVVGYILLFPIDYQYYSKNALASILFISNMYYGLNSNYFDNASETNILLHTWSLSVEWQFYLILPVFLLCLNRYLDFDRRKYIYLFTIATSSLFLFSIFYSNISPTASFYVLPTRSWEMLVGGIAFLIEGKIKIRCKRRLSLVGYLTLLFCIVFLDASMTWPGLYTLIPVLGTFIVIVSNANDLSFLKWQVVQFVGKISYSLYLWHWPVLVIGTYIGFNHGLKGGIIYLIISFFIAVFSYFVIESRRDVGIKNIALVCFFSVCILSFNVFRPLNTDYFSSTIVNISNYALDHQDETAQQFGTGSCFIARKNKGRESFDIEKCLTISSEKRNIVLIGDSHAAHLSQSMKEQFAELGVNLSQASASGCLPFKRKVGKAYCNEVMAQVYDVFLPLNKRNVDGVILSAHWLLLDQDQEQLIKELKETLTYLNFLGLKTIIIGQNETYKINYTSIAARNYQQRSNLDTSYLVSEGGSLNERLKREFPDDYVDIYNLEEINHLSDRNIPYMSDLNHFTKYGADLVVMQLIQNDAFKKLLDN